MQDAVWHTGLERPGRTVGQQVLTSPGLKNQFPFLPNMCPCTLWAGGALLPSVSLFPLLRETVGVEGELHFRHIEVEVPLGHLRLGERSGLKLTVLE